MREKSRFWECGIRHKAALLVASTLVVGSSAWAGAPPPNDDFAQAAVIEGASSSALTYNTNATTEPDEPQHGGQVFSHSLWWTWTAPATGWADFSTYGSGSPLLLAVYTGDTLSTLSSVAVNSVSHYYPTSTRTDSLNVPVVAGQTYHIAVAVPQTSAGIAGTSPNRVVFGVNQAPTILSDSLMRGTQGKVLSYQITSTNGPREYSAQGLPPGLTLDRVTGAVSGTPTISGSYDAQLSAIAPGGTATATVRFEIVSEASPVEPPDFTTGDANVTGYVGASIDETFWTDYGMTDFSAAPLPPGLTATLGSSGSSVEITGTPTQAGTYKTTLRATNAAGSHDAVTTFQILATPPLPIITSAAVASGTVGASFYYSFYDQYVPNFDPNPVYTVGDLPQGLAFNGTAISGTPTTAGTFKVPVHATNSAGTTDALLTIVVAAADDALPSPTAAPLIASAAGAVGSIGSTFSYSISGTNSPASYSATGLPAGVTINPTTGQLSGTPTQSGNFTASISATNALGTTTSSLTLAIKPQKPPLLTSPAAAAGTVGISFSYTLMASDSEFTFPTGYPYGSPISFQVGILPSGLSFLPSSPPGFGPMNYGYITGTPTAAGTYRVPISAIAHGVTARATLTIIIAAQPTQPPVVTNASVSASPVGVSFSQTLAATNLPTSFSASNLPPGLSFDASTNTISGTPTQAGIFVADVSATNSIGTGSAKITYTFGAASTPSPSTSNRAAYEGKKGQSLDDYVYFSNLGSDTPTFSASGLPAGLKLGTPTAGTSYALITGTPTEAGTFPVTIQATSSGGSTQTAQTLVIRPSVDLPTLTGDLSADGYVGQSSFSYYIYASGEGTLAYAAGSLPTGLIRSGQQIFGTPTTAGTYEVPVSVTNAAGTSSGVITIRIAALPPAPTPNLPACVRAYYLAKFSYSFPSTLGVSYQLLSGALPAGVSFNSSSPGFSGTPTQAGNFPLQIMISGPGGSITVPLTLVIDPTLQPAPVITSPIAAFWSPGSTSYTLAASNNPTSYSASGLPAGVTFNGTSLSGPIQNSSPKTYPVTISATNSTNSVSATASLLNFPNYFGGFAFGPAMALGVLNSPFTYRFNNYVSSTSSRTYSASGLPKGLSMDASTSVISGTPTEYGRFPVKLSAIGFGPYPIEATLTLIIQATPPRPIITSNGLLTGTVGTSFSSTIVAPNVAYFATDSVPMPPGLSLEKSTGKITGTPTTAGRYTVKVTLSNGGGVGTFDLIFDLAATPAAPAFSSDAAARGYVGASFDYSASASNQPTRYEADGLPPGLAINSTSGYISGYPSQVGHTEVTLRAINAGGIATAKLSIDITLPDSPVISSSNFVENLVGTSISYTIDGSDAPTSFSANDLPPGLSVNPSTGSITGVATTPGTYLTQISATNAGGTGTANVLFHVLSGKPSRLSSSAGAAGLIGEPFYLYLSSTESGSTYDAETLPPGLTLAGRQVSGTPTTAGDYAATIHVRNGDSETKSTISFHIAATPSLPPIITSPLTEAVTLGVNTDYQVAATGAPSEVDATTMPEGLAYNSSSWTFSGFPDTAGNYSVEITATNAVGSSTAQVTFLAVAPDPTIYATNTNISVGTGQAVSCPVSLVRSTPNFYNFVDWPQSSSTSTLAVRGLPPGLYYDAGNQSIQGTATLAGDYAVELVTADVFGNLATTRVTFHVSDAEVSAPPLQISSGTDLCIAGTAGSPFTTDVWPIGTVTDISVTGLPPGLSVTPTSGTSNGFPTKFAKVTGTPTTPGIYPVEFTFTDGTDTASATVSIVIPEHPTTPGISSSLITHGTVGRSFSYSMYDSYVSYFQNDASTGVVSGLPDGLTFDLGRRMISGTPTAAGRYTVPVTLTNSGGDTEATLTIDIEDPAAGLPRLSGSGGLDGMPLDYGLAAQTTGYAGQAFQFSLFAENDVTDLTVSGLPDGLHVHRNGSSWIVEGSPLTAGTFALVILASNDAGTTTFPLALSVRGLDQVTDAPLPDPTPAPSSTPDLTASATAMPNVVLDKPRRILTSTDHLVIRGHIPDYPPGTHVTVLVNGKWRKVRLTANGSFKLRLSDIPEGRSKISVRVTNAAGRKKTIHLQIFRSGGTA